MIWILLGLAATLILGPSLASRLYRSREAASRDLAARPTWTLTPLRVIVAADPEASARVEREALARWVRAMPERAKVEACRILDLIHAKEPVPEGLREYEPQWAYFVAQQMEIEAHRRKMGQATWVGNIESGDLTDLNEAPMYLEGLAWSLAGSYGPFPG